MSKKREIKVETSCNSIRKGNKMNEHWYKIWKQNQINGHYARRYHNQ